MRIYKSTLIEKNKLITWKSQSALQSF